MATPTAERLISSFCETLIDTMKLKLISIGRLAKKLGVSKKYLKQLINGNYDTSLSEIANIFYALDIEVEFKKDYHGNMC